MSLLNLHLHAFTDAEWAKVKPILQGEVAELKTFVLSETDKLGSLVKDKFPALAAAFHAGFDEVENDTSVTGLAKMEKVVGLVLPQIPEIASELSDLPNLKDFLIQTGQQLFTDTLHELEKAAGDLVQKLLGGSAAPETAPESTAGS